MSVTSRTLTTILSLFIPVSALWAHPHIWAHTTLKLLTQDDKFQGFQVTWVFDELYSTSFLLEADTNKNHKLDPEEADFTINAVFTEGEEDLFPFFHIAPHLKTEPFSLQNPQISMTAQDELMYKFDVIFDVPTSLKGSHKFGIFDPEFYVAFEQDLDLIIPKNANCTQYLQEDLSISIYNGLVNPETYTLTCS